MAQQAAKIVAAIRQDEIENYWRHHGVLGQEEAERFAGMMFPKARPYILQCKLWKIVQRFPKGALLHAHWNAMLPFSIIFDTLLQTEGMVISSSQALSTDLSRQNATLTVSHVNITIDTSSVTPLNSPDYVSGTQIPLTVAADGWSGGRDGFVDFLKSKVTLSEQISIRHDLGVDAVWNNFRGYFSSAGSLLSYEPVFRTFFQSLLRSLAEDGINWVEMRSDVSIQNLVPQGQATVTSDPDFPWQVIVEEIDKFKASEEGKDFWGFRVIWSDRRAQNTTVITNSAYSLRSGMRDDMGSLLTLDTAQV